MHPILISGGLRFSPNESLTLIGAEQLRCRADGADLCDPLITTQLLNLPDLFLNLSDVGLIGGGEHPHLLLQLRDSAIKRRALKNGILLNAAETGALFDGERDVVIVVEEEVVSTDVVQV